jgi:hypothetical protein
MVIGPGAAFRRKEAINLREQPLGQMTFVDKTVGAVATTFIGQRKAVQFGKNNDAQVGIREPDALGRFQTIDAGHAEIQENQIGLMKGHELNGVEAVTGGAHDFKAASEFEVIADRAKSRRRVVCDKDANQFGRGHKRDSTWPD